MIRLGVDGRELRCALRTGIGRSLTQTVRAVAQAGWECVVYGNCVTRLPMTLPGVVLEILGAPWTQWWDQVSLPRRLAEDQVSVFLSPYYKGPLFSPCPTVITIHDLLFIRYPGCRRPWFDKRMTLMAKLYASRATAIITDSEYSKRAILSLLHVPAEKVRVIPIAPDPVFRPIASTDAALLKYGLVNPYLLYVGNFKPHKNLHRLLHSYAALERGLRAGVPLVLAGMDEEHRPPLLRLAGTLGIADQVKFPGMIDDHDLPALYSGAAALVLPSLVEGFGLPALEAMCCGTPVVASNRAAIPEVVGEAGILFDPEDVPSMARAMTQVLTDAQLRERLRQQGLARAAEFTPERTTDQILSLLKDLCLAGTTVGSRVSAVPRLHG